MSSATTLQTAGTGAGTERVPRVDVTQCRLTQAASNTAVLDVRRH